MRKHPVERNLFGDPVTKDDGIRFVARYPQKPWTVDDECLIWPLLIASGCRVEWWDLSTLIATAIGRSPHSATMTLPDLDPGKPGLAGYQDRLASIALERENTSMLINRRPITEQLCQDQRNCVTRAMWNRFTGRRTGLPLNWAEKNLIIWPWSDPPKQKEKLTAEQLKSCKSYGGKYKKQYHKVMCLDDVLVVLDRGQSDAKLVRQYACAIQNGDIHPNQRYTGEKSYGLYSPGNECALFHIVLNYHRSPLPANWTALIDFLDRNGGDRHVGTTPK